MKNLYGDYVVLYKMTDADEILEKITRVIPALVRQIQMMNQSLGYQLDLDTLQFIVHTKSEHGVTVGWKCYEKEVQDERQSFA